jgi:hypothetical protein
MQLLSLKSAIQRIVAQAEQLSNQSERQTLYAHTCQVLALLLEAPGEAGPGWPKAALLLLRPQPERQSGPSLALSGAFSTPSRSRSHSVVETTSAPQSSLAMLQEQLLTILELPDITTLAALDDIQQPIEQAISVGAPRYNRGDIAGCARLYLATALTLTSAQVSRGFPGQARALDTLKKGLVEAQALNDADSRAWALRHAFDRVLK